MTHSKMKVLPQALLAALIVTPMAFAQTSAPQKVEKVEVTGSNIKRVDAETTSPITIITSEEIKRSGFGFEWNLNNHKLMHSYLKDK